MHIMLYSFTIETTSIFFDATGSKTQLEESHPQHQPIMFYYAELGISSVLARIFRHNVVRSGMRLNAETCFQ